MGDSSAKDSRFFGTIQKFALYDVNDLRDSPNRIATTKAATNPTLAAISKKVG